MTEVAVAEVQFLESLELVYHLGQEAEVFVLDLVQTQLLSRAKVVLGGELCVDLENLLVFVQLLVHELHEFFVNSLLVHLNVLDVLI